MNSKIYLNSELEKIFSKIYANENFALLRYGDGERSLMLGKSVHAQEGWKAPERITTLGEALIESLNFIDNNVYYGISCPCCDRESYYWYSSHIKNKNITFANIFVNANYRNFIEYFEKINRDAIVIANEAGQNNKIGNLNILKYYPIGNQCVDQWEQEGRSIIQKIKEDFGDRNDLLYVFSAGPLSEPIISALYKNNPNNCYIDFGSSIDKYIHQIDTRPYTNPNSSFGKRVCWMYAPEETNFEVTVVLSSYKKPDALEKQLIAIENQSLKPKAIMLYQDGIDGYYSINYKDEFLKRFNKVHICDTNTGVWPRFKFASLSDTEYVCVFDDDTIPGRRWLENCHFNMLEKEGVYGTIGIVVENFDKYPDKGYHKIGWLGPYSYTAEVDFVGHSWFVKRVYLDYMFDGTEKYQVFKRAAEDMCLSFKCKQKGINTYVPPHPYYDTSVWGSQPDTGIIFGNSSVAISQNREGINNMCKALIMFANDGWVFYEQNNKRISRKIKHAVSLNRYKMFLLKVYRKLKMKFY